MHKLLKQISSPFQRLLKNYTCLDIKRDFKEEARELAIKLGVKKLECKTIRAIYHELNRKDAIVQLLENNEASFEEVKTIILEHDYKNHNYQELLAAHGRSKKERLGLDVKDIILLNLENRHIDRIIDRLVQSKERSRKNKNSRQVTLDELKTLYFTENQNIKILESYLKAKKDVKELAPELFIKAVFKGINPDDLADIQRILTKNKLKLPDKILMELFDKNINILKTIKILAEAKRDSTETVKRLFPIFSDAQADKFANDYTVEGKNKLKKSISATMLRMNLLEDPAEIYLKLVKSEGNGFKINLETIKDYILYDFTPNIDTISQVYQHARANGLKIKYDQLAKLSLSNIDIKAFVDAEIKSLNHEIKNSI